MNIADHCRGHWKEIISALLGEEYSNSRRHLQCPLGHGKDCFRFSDRDGVGNYFCKCSDGKSDGFRLLMCVKGWTFREAREAVESIIGKCDDEVPVKHYVSRDKISANARKVKRSKYLESRGLEMPDELRFCDRVDYYDEDGKIIGGYPAMVAPVKRDKEFLTWHVTYLQDGKKAPVTPCRKIMSGPGNSGASVQLYEPAEDMGVAEGIETSIAAHMLFKMPVWAALNTSLMKEWQPPKIAKRIVIFGDRDANYAGQAAAYALAFRLSHKGLNVVVEFPPEVGTDWNDFLLTQGAK